MLTFLNNLDTPSKDPDMKEELDKPLTLEKVTAMQSGKAPGPDGSPGQMASHLQNVFNQISTISP